MIGERLRKLREKRKLSQLAFSKRLNIPNQNISNYERNFRQPDYDTLKRIANFFEVSTDYLLGHTNTTDSKIPSWATAKDIRDLKKFLESPEVMYDGEPMDEEDRGKVQHAMELIFWDAKKKNKRKPINED